MKRFKGESAGDYDWCLFNCDSILSCRTNQALNEQLMDGLWFNHMPGGSITPDHTGNYETKILKEQAA